jgi:hypothetical protein
MKSIVEAGYKIVQSDNSIYKEDDIFIVTSPIYFAGIIYDYHIKEFDKVDKAIQEFLK